MTASADVVVIGAGIAGVAAAHNLATERGVGDVVIVDPRPPLSLTSDKSTESYRNWWPDGPMVQLMNRSIDLLEKMTSLSDDAFSLNQRGYLFATADETTLGRLAAQAELTAPLGAATEIFEGRRLAREYPYLATDAVGAVRAKRAGWFDAQQLGSWMLDRVREAGGALRKRRATGVLLRGEAVEGVRLDDGEVVHAPVVVDAGGPMAGSVAEMAGVDLPLHSELHLKVMFKDHLGTIPRSAPMLIWADPQEVDWTDDERKGLLQAGRGELLGEMPGFCHARPEGGQASPYVVGLWEYGRKVMHPEWPITIDPLYPEVVIRGLSRMIPALSAYRDAMPEAVVDGGYYTKTPENRPLVGPCGPEGFHVIAGLSGFGVMVAAGAADLLGAHITASAIPTSGKAFLPSRYDDPSYMNALESLESGQL